MHCLLHTKETEPDLIGIQVLLHGCYKYICIHSLVKLYFSTSASKQICTIPYAISAIQSSNIFWSSQIPCFGLDQFLKWKLAISRVYWSWHNPHLRGKVVQSLLQDTWTPLGSPSLGGSTGLSSEMSKMRDCHQHPQRSAQGTCNRVLTQAKRKMSSSY